MRILYTFLFFPILFFGQVCDSLQMQSLVNIGPLQISEINESMGLRNGTDYNGATIYYPINQNNLSSIVLVPFISFNLQMKLVSLRFCGCST